MSAAMHNVTAQTRSARGKSEVRRLRSTGKVPAIAYGKDLANTMLAVMPKDIVTILKSERGQNTVLSLKVEGGNDMLVMIKDYSYHPVTRSLEHIDFVEVKLDRQVDVEVPLIALGKPAGVAKGGILRQVYRTVPVRCLPDRIPLKLEAEVSHLELREGFSAKELKLPEGVEVRLPPEQTVLSVVAPEKERAEDVVATSTPGAPAAGAAAAPAAAGGKAPAAAAAAPAKDEKKPAAKK